MMRNLFNLFVILTLFSTIILGQTTEEMQRYLHPTEQANSSTEQNILTFGNISVALEFDKNGQICQAIFPSKSYSNNVITVGISRVEGNEIKAILNILAPSEFRGKPNTPWGLSDTGGRMVFTTYTYQNVIVKTSSSIDFPSNPLKGSRGLQGEFVLLDNPDEILSFDINDIEEENLFVRRRNAEEILGGDVATIKWLNRQCVE